MKWTRRASAKDSTRSRRRSSLQLEPLEGRALLATTAASLNQVLVEEYYGAFLGRAADSGGLTFWTAQLAKGVSPNTVGLRIADSTESATDFVTTQYRNFLGRAPDKAGLTAWLGQLQSGRTPDQVAAGILGSKEFFADAGSTNQGFVTALYTDVLGRAPDPSGNTFWLNALARGVSRTTVALGFVTSRERAVQEVTAAYEAVLGRAPDSAGLNFWATALTGPHPRLTGSQALVDFIDSPENINRINTAIAAAPTSPTTTTPTTTTPVSPTTPTTTTPVSPTMPATTLSAIDLAFLAAELRQGFATLGGIEGNISG